MLLKNQFERKFNLLSSMLLSRVCLKKIQCNLKTSPLILSQKVTNVKVGNKQVE